MSIQQFVQLHKEHQEWLHEMDSYQDEISFFQHSLCQVSSSDENKERAAKAARYRQECLENLQQLDTLRFQIYKNEAEVAKRMELADRLKEHVVPQETHEGLRNMMEEYILAFKAFKKNVNGFLLDAKKA